MCYSESALPKLYRDSPYEYLLDLGSDFLPPLHLNAISQMEYNIECVVNIALLFSSSESSVSEGSSTPAFMLDI